MAYVPDWVTLTEGEEIVWSGGPSPVRIVPQLFAEVALIIVGLAVVAVGPGLVADLGAPAADALPVGIAYIGLLLVLVGFLAAALTYLRHQAVEYLVTTEELYVKRGLLSRSVTNLRLDRIQDTGFEQSAFQRMLNYGDVFVSTAGSGGAELIFTDVEDPATVNSIVTEELDAARTTESQSTGTRSTGTRSTKSVDPSERSR